MGYLNLLDVLGNISNKDDCVRYLKGMSGKVFIDTKSINEFYKSVDNGLTYLTNSLKVLQDNTYNAYYLWVNTGLKEQCTGEVIYISFYKSSLGWEGGFVGTENILRKTLKKSSNDTNSSTHTTNGFEGLSDSTLKELENYKNSIEVATDESEFDKSESSKLIVSKNAPVEVSKETLVSYESNIFNNEDSVSSDNKNYKLDCIYSSNIANLVYERLSSKTSWTNPVEQISNYLCAYVSRVSALVLENKCTECFAFNKARNRFIFNIGLLDKFGNDILLEAFYSNGYISSLKIVESKFYLSKRDYDSIVLDRYIEPVKFTTKKEDLFFKGSFNEFDLTNWGRLEHILTERRDRFPSECRNQSADILYEKLVASIRSAVNISRRDARYILPMYSIEMNVIQFLIPYNITSSFCKVPDLAILVGSFDGCYNVMTVLPLKDVYPNYRVLSPYSDSWLSKGVLGNK